jgi:hypothetical protein
MSITKWNIAEFFDAAPQGTIQLIYRSAQCIQRGSEAITPTGFQVFVQ